MPIALVAAGIGAAGAVGGALISSSAADAAAGDAASAAAADNALEKQIYETNTALAQPYIEGGDAANAELAGFLGLNGDPAASQAAFQKYLDSTGYQFDLASGSRAVTGDKAAAGLLDSGSTLKALNAFGTGLADQYGQHYVGDLQGVADAGQRAVSGLTGAGETYGAQVAGDTNAAAGVAGNAAVANGATIEALIGNAFKGLGGFAGYGGSSFGGGGYNAFAPGVGG